MINQTNFLVVIVCIFNVISAEKILKYDKITDLKIPTWSVSPDCVYADSYTQYTSSGCTPQGFANLKKGSTGYWSNCANSRCSIDYTHNDDIVTVVNIEVKVFANVGQENGKPKLEISYMNGEDDQIFTDEFLPEHGWHIINVPVMDLLAGGIISIQMESDNAGNSFIILDEIKLEFDSISVVQTGNSEEPTTTTTEEPTTTNPLEPYLIYSENSTNWGSWAQSVELCPPNTFADAFEIKNQPYQGLLRDDTSMNGIRLYCDSHNNPRPSIVTSSVGDFGDWTKEILRCPDNGLIDGFQLRVEGQVIRDNTATNNIRILCNKSNVPLESTANDLGQWRSRIRCASGFAICGLKTQVQPDQGQKDDDTALNNVAFLCCPLKLM